MTDVQMLSGLAEPVAKDVQEVSFKLHVSDAMYLDQVTIT